MLFVTLHGNKPGEDSRRNNVHAYDKDGNKITSSVLDENPDVILTELRGLYLVGAYLYVANANKTQNSVLCYEGTGTQYKFVGEFASKKKTCSGIVHPFDFTFDGLGYCYLSSQDTNVVTRLQVSSDGKTASPAQVAAAVSTKGTFLPGTFVPSSNGNLSTPPTPSVPTPAGLAYSDAEVDGKAKKHSVRGVVWTNGRLYVADQPARTVKIYDITGKYLGQSNELEPGSPVHLVVHNGSLYISGGNQIYTARIPSSPSKLELTPIDTVKVKNSSGMAFGKQGNFYVASRTENTIQKFDPNFKPLKFRCKLPDCPEFLLHV